MEAEAIILKEALSWAKELQLDWWVFETDSRQLLDACKGKQGAGYFHTIVSDCVGLCKNFDQVLISFVHRSVNSVAHCLATHSLSNLREWFEYPPQFICHDPDSDYF